MAYAEIRRECPIAVIRTHPEWEKICRPAALQPFEINADFFNFVRAYMLAQPETPETNTRQESQF